MNNISLDLIYVRTQTLGHIIEGPVLGRSKMRKSLWTISIVLLSVAAAAPSVHASPITYNFSITGGYTASGTLTLDSLSGGSYPITGISGTQDGQAITMLIPPGGFAGNDNLLYASPPLLDFAGLSFVAGGVD